jgi:hypothetical protein
MRKKKIEAGWEIVGYIALLGLVIGQVIVGYWYLAAQTLFLVCNLATTIRCFAIHQSPADKVKNCVFTAISVGLIILRLSGV